ncbi:Major Facilitator Superfamily protein [Aspergillus flavus]|nr:Major Facilitator Superfamily protein [Aspergillus flavus]
MAVENAIPTTSSTDAQALPDEPKPAKKGYGWRFWAIFPGLCVGGLLSALDTTILSTVLPTISHNLDSQTAVQPLYGQVANIFGRRWPTILSVALFALRSLLPTWCLPVYFQLVPEATPKKSGIDLFASFIPMVSGAIVGGVLITVTGKYKPLLVAGFILMAVGMGLFTMLDDRTNTVRWVIYQVILALGSGISLIATLPAVLASLPESDVATATATWAFLRSFGSIWCVSIPSAVFNSRFTDLVGRIASPQLRGVLVGGGAYQLATKAFMESLDDTPVVKAQVVSVYVDSLKLVWQIGIAFAALGVPLSLLIRSLALRDELNAEFGLEETRTENVEEVRVQ